MLAGSPGRALVLAAVAARRLQALEGGAVAGAVDLAVVARIANADFDRATRAAEEATAVDHLSLGR